MAARLAFRHKLAKILDVRFALSLLLSLLIHAILLYSSNTARPYLAQSVSVNTWHGFEIRIASKEVNRPVPQTASADILDEAALTTESHHTAQASGHSDTPSSTQSSKSEQIKTRLTLPVFDAAIEPVYPIQLLANGLRGSVKATFQIGVDGQINNIQIVDSKPTGRFDEVVFAAIKAATIKKGSATPGSRFSITVIFDPSGTGAEGAVLPYLTVE